MDRGVRTAVYSLLLCLGVCAAVVACVATTQMSSSLQKPANRATAAHDGSKKEEEAPERFYVVIIGCSVALACVSFVSYSTSSMFISSFTSLFV